MTTHKLRLRNGIDWRLVEGEVIALDSGRSVYLSGNATAADLWPLLVGGTDETSLVAVLAKKYGRAPASVTEDVAAFVSTLNEHGLLANADD